MTTIVAGAGGSCCHRHHQWLGNWLIGTGFIVVGQQRRWDDIEVWRSSALGPSGKGSSSLVNAGARGIVVNDAGGGMMLELGGHRHQAHLSGGLTTVVAMDLTVVAVAAVHCHSCCCHLRQ